MGFPDTIPMSQALTARGLVNVGRFITNGSHTVYGTNVPIWTESAEGVLS